MRVKDKLKEKKWYQVFIHEEGAWNTTLRIPTFDRLVLNDKKHMGVEQFGDEVFVVYNLRLDKEELLVFKTVYKNYLKYCVELTNRN